MLAPNPEIDLQLHPKQAIALDTEANEVLYGGAAGGGKSFLMRCAAILWCAAVAGLQVYLFRRVRDDLVKNHMEGPKGFRALLAPWVLCRFVRIVDDEIRFWNGSRIYLCHCKDAKDIYKYQGAEIHVLLIDELTHWTEAMYRFLRNRCRQSGLKTIPEKWRHRFPRILCSANPGNIGHLFVKSTFVEGVETYAIRDMPDDEGGMRRQFIPAQLEDNPSLMDDDPGYERRMAGLGSKELVRAMRYGDWDVIEGAFFDCWEGNRHVVRPFAIPATWTRFRSGDWGSAKPFSFGWWAVVGEECRVPNRQDQLITLPRGCLVRYREWYGMKEKQANVGLKLDNEMIGEGLVEREHMDPRLDYGVLDPACFTANGGKSIEEQIYTGMVREGKARNVKPMPFVKADNTRNVAIGAAGGWGEMRSRLVGDDDGHPMVVCFSTCLDSIRTIPALQHDPVRLEDLDSDGEDHAADEWRYACASRPWVKTAPKAPAKRKSGYTSSVNQDQGSWRT